ncbi:MAG: hypothetical protein F6K30_04365 [Cyanothece sp. SIO2G6]|nr:hypothetical protein [Cyanothece sp. SIO2G6]
MSEHRLDEILIERPRHGWRQKTPRGNKFMRQITQEASTDGLLCPYRIKTRHRTKYLSDHLGPLRRFLRSKVGQRWDDIYSELSQRLDRDSVLGQHVIDHLWDYVCLNVEMIDGLPYAKAGQYCWWRTGPLESRRHQFYVHPETGILCSASQCSASQSCYRKRDRPSTTVNKTTHKHYIRLDDYREYRKIEDIWYEVEYRAVPQFELVWDVVRKTHVGTGSRHWKRSPYSQKPLENDLYAFRKRQCNKKELKGIRKLL